MEDVESDDVARNKPGLGEPIKEASTAIDEEDAELVYDHTHFQRDKVRHRYFRYYHGRRIIVERGAIIEEFDECAEGTSSDGCPGFDRHGRGSPPYNRRDSLGVHTNLH
jgi:hypothetical protein